ncbi:protein of unknown function [Poseidonocella pacifica]|uniref:DUF1127 domain-containing protein n=1 Tax=Poseidonocella pacifica TaxID=871651 RepID=A0A1I0XDN2_9RHOB|nr:DUF1127 domain-containing protein [Poseidonocella pacifica]SFA98536.1 protein of unknown function [Poseidonocella pacifica]
MATIASNQTSNPLAQVGSYLLRGLTAVGMFIVSIGEANRYAREIRNLDALSDAQLAKRGLKREDIPRHVLRGAYFI